MDMQGLDVGLDVGLEGGLEKEPRQPITGATAYLQKSINEGLEEAAALSEDANREKEISQAITQSLLIALGFLVLVVVLWFGNRLFVVVRKYAQLISLLGLLREQGWFTLTPPVVLAWCAEYPNFTTLLFSKILNRNFPKAVALAFYTVPYSEYFSEDDLERAAYQINKMLEFSEFNGDAGAEEIICGAWGYDAGIKDCLDPCPLFYRVTAGDVALRSMEGVAQGAFLGSMAWPLISVPAAGAGAAAIAVSSGPFFLVVGATALILAGVQTYLGVRDKREIDSYCNNIEDYFCRPSSVQQCL